VHALPAATGRRPKLHRLHRGVHEHRAATVATVAAHLARQIRSLGSPAERAAAVGFAQKHGSHPVVADDLPVAAVLVEQSGETRVSRGRFR
jgi:hypothetical protein